MRTVGLKMGYCFSRELHGPVPRLGDDRAVGGAQGGLRRRRPGNNSRGLGGRDVWAHVYQGGAVPGQQTLQPLELLPRREGQSPGQWKQEGLERRLQWYLVTEGDSNPEH